MSMKTTNMNPSSFHSGLSIQDAADQKAGLLVASARAGTLDEGDSYGSTPRAAVSYLLEGGGPGAEITFVLDIDGDVVDAVFTYTEADGLASVPLDQRSAEVIYKGLNTPPAADD